jgi:methylamine dehydrogenase accessory protein MauD
MTGLALAFQILSWIAIAVLGVLVAALARQVGVLHERIAPAGALTLHQKVDVGDKGPEMTLPALDGGEVRIGGRREGRSQLLFFLSPDCPVCKTLLPVLKSAARAEHRWVDTVLASDGDEADHRRLVMAHDLAGIPYVLSEALGRALGVSKLPYAVLLDERGRIASLGLINNREHLESLFEAKERGVASIQHFLSNKRA